MKYRAIPRTDLSVSLIGLGTMTWGEQNTEAEGHEQMDYAVERGINLFDVAEMYPVPPRAETCHETERIIGTWFASRPGARERIVLATKVVGPVLRTPSAHSDTMSFASSLSIVIRKVPIGPFHVPAVVST